MTYVENGMGFSGFPKKYTIPPIGAIKQKANTPVSVSSIFLNGIMIKMYIVNDIRAMAKRECSPDKFGKYPANINHKGNGEIKTETTT